VQNKYVSKLTKCILMAV